MSRALQPGHEFVLTLRCPDRPGIVFAVSSFLLQHSGNIHESQQFDDRLEGRLLMRVHFEVSNGGSDAAGLLTDLRTAFEPVAESFSMSWTMSDASTPTRTMIMVSRFGHCLNDLLYRTSTGSLPIEVAAVVSNHEDLAPLAATHGVPFHHLPVTATTKLAAEARLLALVDELDVELVVLARYMQVLSDDLCRSLAGRAINIHHSFLPSFKGAKPYHQAHARGVKLIGATAHYVTPDLDEGPIIEQDVARAGHSMDPDELVAAGRDVEAQVLARAVTWHSQHRVLLNGHRTVVFH